MKNNKSLILILLLIFAGIIYLSFVIDKQIDVDNQKSIDVISDEGDSFIQNIDIDYAFDSTTNANYTIVRIYKNRIDGTKQYPF
ncbi:MAG: hypothetical protein IJZ16_14400, partial [Clostridia bacterium]|nr:hypothetical protein [Clostridia bacterium]